MIVGFSIFSLYIAPLIACIALLISLFRLRSWLLIGVTIIAVVLIITTSSNPIFAVTLNPYLMLILLSLALFNTVTLTYLEAESRPYVIQADVVMLLMIIALYLWATYLRQSDLYFYEQSDYWARTFPLILTSLSLAIPISAILIRFNVDNGRRWSQGMVVGLIMLSLVMGFIIS